MLHKLFCHSGELAFKSVLQCCAAFHPSMLPKTGTKYPLNTLADQLYKTVFFHTVTKRDIYIYLNIVKQNHYFIKLSQAQDNETLIIDFLISSYQNASVFSVLCTESN